MSGEKIADALTARIDESPDGLFYREPRFVTHIDPETIDALRACYRERLPQRADVLDLMSSWVSHLPADVGYARVVGLGMNAEELAANPQLTERIVRDLNADPGLPFEDAAFDAVLIAVSIQYLVHPIEVVAEIRRVLRPGGECLVAVSHRLFPTKAIALFRSQPPREWPRIVASYFDRAGGFETPLPLDRSPHSGRPVDPLWVIAARTSRAITPRP